MFCEIKSLFQVVLINVHKSDTHTVSAGSGLRQALKMERYAYSLDDGPQLTEQLILVGIKSIVEALEYVHHRGIVHVDIKPSNFVLGHGGAWHLTGGLLSMGAGTCLAKP